MSATTSPGMRLRAALAACVAVVVVLAGCDGAEDVSTPARESVPSPERTGPGLDPDAPAPAPDVTGHQLGGDLQVLAKTVPLTFDPTRMSQPDELAIMSLVTRSLTQYTYDRRSRQMVLVPDLATDLGRPNKDRTEWTFTLRPDLRYADGSAVRAADVAYAIKRSFATSQLPGGSGHNVEHLRDGGTYRGPFTDGAKYAGVSVDGDSITIETRRPFADMPQYASFPAFSPIPAEADVRPQAYGLDPLATGPYQFEDYRPGKSLVLSRNRYWDPASDPGRHQYPDTWTFRFGVNANLIDELLIDDEDRARTTTSYTGIQAKNYPRATLDDGLRARVVRGTSACTDLWYLDTRTITDLEVRRAIGLAFPYRQYWRVQNRIEGVTWIPATTILPPGTNGRVAYDVLGNAGARTDPDAARNLLEQSGNVGFALSFAVPTDDPHAGAWSAVVTDALEKAGFQVTAVPMSDTGPAAEGSDPAAPVSMRPGQWCVDWPSGSLWFPEQWRGGLNPSLLDRPDVNAKIGIARLLSGAKAAKAWGELDRYIQQTYYPAVTVGYPGIALMHGSRVGGMTINDIRGMPNFTDMFVTRP